MCASRPGGPRLTLFTATVYPDVARLWHACIRRAFPPDEVRVEIFYDSGRNELEPGLFEGATILHRSAARREFHEAYNDALRRCTTPYLAFVDSDIFWTSSHLWPRIRSEMERSPEVASFSCISRHERKSHGTFAVVMKVDSYRQALAELPGGFFPGFENMHPDTPRDEWIEYDAGDLATQAVLDGGFEVRLLNLEKGRELVRFDGITLSRLGGERMGERALTVMTRKRKYYWRGYVGNLVLQGLHDRLFPSGPRYDFPFRRGPLLVETLRADPRKIPWRLGYVRRLLAGARRVESYVRRQPPHPGAP